ncbi:MAG: endonuclease III [Clostridiaceae bacterium BRH_c20a]|nr:MAG: endonuclease III [Clostridiaceae bacterium BRH_c20a]
MNHQEILDKLRECYPEVKTALRFQNPFELLIATILSAQSTDKQVNKVTQSLFEKYPDAYGMSMLSAEELEQEIKSIGLYKNKSKNIVTTSKMLVEKYNGIVPCTREELITLPGVGRKTANVVLSNAYNIPAIAVDTHVFRVANRLGLTKSSNPLQTEEQLMAIIPDKDWSDAHHWLIWHGRLVCKARKPECQKCRVNYLCQYLNKSV